MAKKPTFPTRRRGTAIHISRNESSEQKAMWHNVQGAGRSHVIRKFFDLSPALAEKCRTKLQNALDVRLRSLSR